MTRYVSFKQDKTIPAQYQEDVVRLRAILAENDVYAKDWCIYSAWGAVSDAWCAGWLTIKSFEKEAFNMIMEYLE